MNLFKTALLFLCLFPTLLSSQLFVDDDSFEHEIISLVDHHSIHFSVTTTVINNTGEWVDIEVTTESKNFSSEWEIIDESPNVDRKEFNASSFEVQTYLTIVTNNLADVSTGIETLKIYGTDAHGEVVADFEYDISYTVVLPPVPEPSFIVTNFEYDSIPVDTVYIPIEILDPFAKDFHSYIELPFLDYYWIERPIIFEPSEIILENIENLDCMHEDPFLEDPSKSWCYGDTIGLTNQHLMHQVIHGNIGSDNDYRMEFLMNIYDPVDSLNSNQKVRFIALDAECIYGQYSNLVDIPNNYVYTCPGGSVTLNARPQYGSLTWEHQSNTPQTFTGSTVSFDNIEESIYLYVTTRDDEGCLLFQNISIEIEQRYEDIVDVGEQEFEVCRGSDLTLNVLPGYGQVDWYNETEGTTITADSYTLTNIQDYVQLIVRAPNADGCFSFQEIYIYINDFGIDAEIIPDSSWQVCTGGDLVLEIDSEFTDVQWNFMNTGQIASGNILELNNVTEYLDIELTAVKDDGCIYRQYIYIYPEDFQEYNPDLLLTNIENELCSKVTLEAADGYENYEWYAYLNGELQLISEEQQLNLDYSSNIDSFPSYLQVSAFGEDGCGDFYEFGISLKDPEERALIDATSVGEYCAGDEIEISVLESYESYQWNYQGQVFTGPSFTFAASTESVELIVLDEDGCSYSDVFYSTVGNLPVPSLCLITNDVATGNNVILWEDPVQATNISKYLIYREGTVTDDFIEIGELDFDEENMFVDKDSDPAQQAYKYHIRATNRCGDLSEPSNVHKTIHLTINQGTNDNVNLIWDSYEGISYDQIKIYRGSSPNSLEEYLGLPGTAFSFTDQNPPAGNVYYQIEVATEIECEIGKALYRIKSNVAAFETIGDSTDELGLTGKIYPNPFGDFIILELEEAVELQVVAMDGRRMLQQQLLSGNHTIATDNFLPGAYIIKVISGDKIFAHTFIKTE